MKQATWSFGGICRVPPHVSLLPKLVIPDLFLLLFLCFHHVTLFWSILQAVKTVKRFCMCKFLWNHGSWACRTVHTVPYPQSWACSASLCSPGWRLASAPCGDAFLILWYQQNDTTLSCFPKVMVQNRECNRFDVSTKIKLITGFDSKQTIHTPPIKLVLLHKDCVRFLKNRLTKQSKITLWPSCWSSLCA